MKRTIAVATGAAALLFLAACGSDDPEAASTPTSTPTAMASQTPSVIPGTIVEVASGNPDFSTLVTAVTTAELADELSAPGPFTVFAPTNEAFEALPDGVLDALLKPENAEALNNVLLYHVVSGEVMSADVEAGDVATLEGSELTLSTEGGVKVNDASVVMADVDASNGVIHVIDEVLIPESVDPADL